LKKFNEFPFPEAVLRNLSAHGLQEATPVQAGAIPPALEGRNVVATAQTGTGKTLAFLLPLIRNLAADPAKGVQAVILTPTRELAIQIHENFQKFAAGAGLKAAVVVGGLNESKQLFEIQRGAQVLVATPGRLEDFLHRKLVKLGAVRMAILDEADRMLDMGFLPAMEKILGRMPAGRQTLFFSATIEKSILPLIGQYVPDAVRVEIGAATKPASEIDLHIYEVESGRKLGLLRHLLAEEAGSVLVFARTKHSTDRLAARLARSGVKAAAIHGDRTQNQRRQALEGFKKGNYRVLVATDLAARGIHVDNIEQVVNFDMPQAPEDFVHRVGRTGRAGQKGRAVTFATRQERGAVRLLERTIKAKLTPMPVPGVLPDDVAENAPVEAPKSHAPKGPSREAIQRVLQAQPKPKKGFLAEKKKKFSGKRKIFA
jgi:ATP-dependent RNA helicase RhlE